MHLHAPQEQVAAPLQTEQQGNYGALVQQLRVLQKYASDLFQICKAAQEAVRLITAERNSLQATHQHRLAFNANMQISNGIQASDTYVHNGCCVSVCVDALVNTVALVTGASVPSVTKYG